MNTTSKRDKTSKLNEKQAAAGGSKGKLKVAIDTHADFDVWVAQFENSAPKPPQKMARARLVQWLGEQQSKGWEVVSCYEAGPFGYGLHRALSALGVRNYVIRPRNWDDTQRGVRTDRTDTRSMLVALDRYEAGQSEALTVVRVPSEAEEQRRTPVRVAAILRSTLQRVAQAARGLALYYGLRLKGAWYSPRRWSEVARQLPEHLVGLMEHLRTVVLSATRELMTVKTLIRQGRFAGEQVPVGMGRETAESMEREVCDWNRFKNRRAVGSFMGLTPGEASSGRRRAQGSITKRGHPRLRWLAVQTAWRLVRFQPEYRGVKRWKERFLASPRSLARKKQWIVALAREFLIDWWRLRTGRTSAEKLGLRMSQA
jgi:transposase